MKLLSKNSISALFLFMFLFLGSVPCFGADAIHLKVDTILAQNKNNGVDTRLTALKAKLQKIFQFSSYRLLSRDEIMAPIGVKSSLSLPSQTKLILKPIAKNPNGRAVVEVSISGPGIHFKSQIRLRKGGTLILGGPKTKEGHIILGLSLS